ncbi:adenylate/guanylate cyclase domain-containing protein [Desulfococcaceae bacterium HSG7]|nr:adenylate/guanylate cyclase domain-containing protein [Desulfococcaceae bacterium HSG7]
MLRIFSTIQFLSRRFKCQECRKIFTEELPCAESHRRQSTAFVESLRLGKLSIPVDQNGRLLLHFRGPKHTFPYISASDVLKDKLEPQSLAGKILFVGTSAAGLHDLRPTPLDSWFPGVEAHATIVDNVLAGDYFFKPDWAPGLEIILIIFTAFITGLLITRLKALWVLPVTLVSGILIWYGSILALGRWRMFISPLFPILSLVMNFSLLTLFKFWISEKKKRFLKATFKSYLPPAVIDEMYKKNVMPRLGGESRNITAFFSDISSFSTFSEKLTAEQLVEVLNEYLSAMTNILADHKGTLDKYEGDGIAAFFNAPLEFEDHALMACKTAVVMQKKQIELRAKWQEEKTSPQEPDRNIKKLPPEEWTPGKKWPDAIGQMTIRIGVNTGEIVVGNMGSEFRMEYTMNGDAVNLASRLEQAGKQYGVGILVSEDTLNSKNPDENGKTRTVGDMMAIRFIDCIIVVGRSEPVKVYEVRAEKGQLTDDEKTLFKLFDEAMACYLEMKWDEAIAEFTLALKLERSPAGKINPSSVYIERCRLYKDKPPVAPGEIWDGVHTLTKK